LSALSSLWDTWLAWYIFDLTCIDRHSHWKVSPIEVEDDAAIAASSLSAQSRAVALPACPEEGIMANENNPSKNAQESTKPAPGNPSQPVSEPKREQEQKTAPAQPDKK
jgi:hypothetical protein